MKEEVHELFEGGHSYEQAMLTMSQRHDLSNKSVSINVANALKKYYPEEAQEALITQERIDFINSIPEDWWD